MFFRLFDEFLQFRLEGFSVKAGAEDSAAVVNQQVGRQAGDGVLPDKLVVPSLEVAGLHPLLAVFPAGLEPVFAAGVEREIQHPEFFSSGKSLSRLKSESRSLMLAASQLAQKLISVYASLPLFQERYFPLRSLQEK